VINKDLRDLAIEADVQQANNKKENKNLEEAANVMSKSFTSCITDRSLDKVKSRKWGTYHISNLLFKTYFKVSSRIGAIHWLYANAIPLYIKLLASLSRSNLKIYVGMCSKPLE